MAKQKRAKKKDGRMVSTFTFGDKRYYVYGFSEQELKEKEFKKRQELEAGEQDREDPTLNSYYERFTDNRRKKVKESTIRAQSFQFRNCADVVICNGKTLGEYRLSEIRPDDIQAVQHELEKSRRKTETVNNCIDHLRHVFNQAVKSEYLNRNPCNAVESLRKTEQPARETIHRALSEEETRLFFDHAKESYYLNAFKLMIQTGMRIGEVGALRFSDINPFQKMLHVRRTIMRDEIGTYVIGETPKTDAGNRDIPITDQVVQTIKSQFNLNRCIFGSKEQETLFRAPEGALLREYPVNREIARICKKAGIEKFTCHAFRATFATRFIEQRPEDYKILSEILGHSNVSITLDLYTHVMKDKKVQAMNAVNIAF